VRVAVRVAVCVAVRVAAAEFRQLNAKCTTSESQVYNIRSLQGGEHA